MHGKADFFVGYGVGFPTAGQPVTPYTTDMGKINAEWHLAHRMPKNPTTEQRLRWHIEHSRHCSCRPLTEKLKAEIAKLR